MEALLDRVLAANSAHVALGLEADATADEHHKAWKKLVLKCHPDKCLDHQQKATEATQHMHALFERERNRHRTHRREPERPPARTSPRASPSSSPSASPRRESPPPPPRGSGCTCERCECCGACYEGCECYCEDCTLRPESDDEEYFSCPFGMDFDEPAGYWCDGDCAESRPAAPSWSPPRRRSPRKPRPYRRDTTRQQYERAWSRYESGFSGGWGDKFWQDPDPDELASSRAGVGVFDVHAAIGPKYGTTGVFEYAGGKRQRQHKEPARTKEDVARQRKFDEEQIAELRERRDAAAAAKKKRLAEADAAAAAEAAEQEAAERAASRARALQAEEAFQAEMRAKQAQQAFQAMRQPAPIERRHSGLGSAFGIGDEVAPAPTPTAATVRAGINPFARRPVSRSPPSEAPPPKMWSAFGHVQGRAVSPNRVRPTDALNAAVAPAVARPAPAAPRPASAARPAAARSSVASRGRSSTARKTRVEFSAAESRCIREGVAKHGTKWRVIIDDPAFTFHKSRSTVDLKDRWRNMNK